MIKIKELFRYMLNAHKAYSGTGMMMALYFVALMVILFYCKDKKTRKSIILPSLFMMGVMYILVPIFDTFKYYLIYYDGRMFWIMITPIIIAIGFTIFIMGIEDERKRVLALVILLPLFLYCGEFKLSNAMYKKAENFERLPQSTMDITEYILSQVEEPKIIVPYTIAHPFRQVSAKVHLLFGEDATYGRINIASDEMRRACDEMERTTPDLNYIVPLARENNVDYIAFDTVYTEFCENGNINIYGYPVDENYVGDRTPTVNLDNISCGGVVDDDKGIYWDLSAYGLNYEGTFGQYILYRLNK
ncbi:MAG: hypothetical protein Q4D29_09415 [Lachnospiraceae bacterium]|nr:hypothetical protein [Lachnospiraceae bacterium]